jgi:hypothetical protein
MANSDTTTAPGSLGSLNPDYIAFMRDAVSALRTDRYTGALHTAAVLDLLSERLGSRADPNAMAAIGLVLTVVGTAMTAEALKP